MHARRQLLPLGAFGQDPERLLAELDEAYNDIVELMPLELQLTLRSFYRCESREASYRWVRETAERMIARSMPPASVPDAYWLPRAACPLCALRLPKEEVKDFTVPEGLRRHLEGFGNVRQCSVMRAACKLAGQHWNSKFGPAERAAEEAAAATLAKRKKSEVLFVIDPHRAPLLLDEEMHFGAEARTAEGLAWAASRLQTLGFSNIGTSDMVIWTFATEGYVTYADPRGNGRITVRVLRAPAGKSRRSTRAEPHRIFDIPDRWRHDLASKFERLLLKAVAELQQSK